MNQIDLAFYSFGHHPRCGYFAGYAVALYHSCTATLAEEVGERLDFIFDCVHVDFAHPARFDMLSQSLGKKIPAWEGRVLDRSIDDMRKFKRRISQRGSQRVWNDPRCNVKRLAISRK